MGLIQFLKGTYMKFLFLSIFSIMTVAGSPVVDGQIITASRFNNQSFTVGDIKMSLLSETQFQSLKGIAG